MLETQPYVKYDTRGQSRYEYSISHVENGKVDAKVSIGDFRQEWNNELQYFAKQADKKEEGLNIEGLDAEYMSDIFVKKIQDTPVFTEEMRDDFYKKVQALVGMLSIEKDRQTEMENAIKGLNRLQSTQQEIDTLTQQLEEVKQENSSKAEPNKDQDKEK